MSAEIKHTYEVSQTSEISVDWNGYNFLVIYGKHVNGWFIAIPNWEISVESAFPGDLFYNTEKISKVISIDGAAGALAMAIKEHFERNKDD